MQRANWPISWWLVLLAAAVAAPSAGADEQQQPAGPASPIDPRGELVERFRAIAEQIKIDGRDDDWAGLPSFEDQSGDGTSDDPSLDIVETSMAPLADAILVRIRTSAPPNRTPSAFWVNVDLWGRPANDFRIGISGYKTNHIQIFESGAPSIYTAIAKMEVAIDEVVEIRLPLAVIEETYRRNEAAFPAEAWSRSWGPRIPVHMGRYHEARCGSWRGRRIIQALPRGDSRSHASRSLAGFTRSH